MLTKIKNHKSVDFHKNRRNSIVVYDKKERLSCRKN